MSYSKHDFDLINPSFKGLNEKVSEISECRFGKVRRSEDEMVSIWMYYDYENGRGVQLTTYMSEALIEVLMAAITVSIRVIVENKK